MKKREKLKISRLINKLWNIGHDNDDPDFDWWEWTCINLIKVIWKRKIATKVKKLAGNPKSLLNLGCGSSPMINMFRKTPYKVGIDINSDKIEFLRSRTDAILMKGDITKPLQLEETFECIICTEVIEHLGTGQLNKAFENFGKYCDQKLIISFPAAETFYTKWFETFLHGHLHHYSDNLSLKKLDLLCKAYNFRYIGSEHYFWDKILLYQKIK